MTKAEAINQIEASLPVLSAEQLQALAELALAYTRDVEPEDDATRDAIAEGLAQADRGEFVLPSEVERLLKRNWK